MVNILLCPNTFKGSLTGDQASIAMSHGCMKALAGRPGDRVRTIVMGDGGDGSGDILGRALHGEPVHIQANNGIGLVSPSSYIWAPDSSTAIIEIAKVAGLASLNRTDRNPMRTSTYGVGEVLRDAVVKGATKIVICCGGSCSNDGGIGVGAALGFRFQDENGNEVEPVGGNLHRIRIFREPIDPDKRELLNLIRRLKIVAAVDTDATFVGNHGATFTFAKQKGARPEDLPVLEEGMCNILSLWRSSDLFPDNHLYNSKGAGAAGGLSAGLIAFCHARIESGFDMICGHVHLREAISEADLVLTGEGAADATSGKVPYEIAKLCHQFGVHCAVITGQIPDRRQLDILLEGGASAGVFSIVPGPIDVDHAIEHAKELLEQSTENVIRAFMAGYNKNSQLRPQLSD